MKNESKGIIYVLICVALWALLPVVSKTGQKNLDNHQFLFWSSLVSFLCFIPATAKAGKIKEFLTYKRKDWFNSIMLGFLGTYLYYILLYYGYANSQGLEVLVLQYSWPILIIILSIFILKERITLKRLSAIMFGSFGVFIVLTKGNFSQIHLDNFSVDILVLAGALTFAIFSVLSKKVHLEAYTMITIYFLTATVASFISMLYLSEFKMPTSDSIIPILINGIFVNGYSYIFWVIALKKADASFIAPFVFLTPIISAFYLIVFFNEPPLPVYGIGIISIIIGGILNLNRQKIHRVENI